MENELEFDLVEGSETPDVDAEKKSVDSVDAAAKGGKEAKKITGAGKGQEKTQLDNKAQDKGTDAGKEPGTSKTNLPGTTGFDGRKDVPSKKDLSVGESADYSAELSDLVESEATLSEEFKEKTAIIFEAALKSKLSEEIDRLEEQYATQLDEEVATYKAEMVSKIDSYLDYVVESWMTENKLAVTNGLRAEIAENFMAKLHGVFTESYITVPAEKEDLVDGLVEHTEELESQLNEMTKKHMTISEELKGLKREMVIRESSKDLAETEVEKLEKLAEDIEFSNVEDFASKVKTIKESIFRKEVKEEVQLEEDFEQEIEVSGAMAAYVNALKK